mmetsp:Transcript_41675/g.126380  ORF Transcript_41675/g.126380 Transcript_41675/m.126380 type:complete len:565 (+) Transcript_41675:1456-3150(+)
MEVDRDLIQEIVRIAVEAPRELREGAFLREKVDRRARVQVLHGELEPHHPQRHIRHGDRPHRHGHVAQEHLRLGEELERLRHGVRQGPLGPMGEEVAHGEGMSAAVLCPVRRRLSAGLLGLRAGELRFGAGQPELREELVVFGRVKAVRLVFQLRPLPLRPPGQAPILLLQQPNAPPVVLLLGGGAGAARHRQRSASAAVLNPPPVLVIPARRLPSLRRRRLHVRPRLVRRVGTSPPSDVPPVAAAALSGRSGAPGAHVLHEIVQADVQGGRVSAPGSSSAAAAVGPRGGQERRPLVEEVPVPRAAAGPSLAPPFVPSASLIRGAAVVVAVAVLFLVRAAADDGVQSARMVRRGAGARIAVRRLLPERRREGRRSGSALHRDSRPIAVHRNPVRGRDVIPPRGVGVPTEEGLVPLVIFPCLPFPLVAGGAIPPGLSVGPRLRRRGHHRLGLLLEQVGEEVAPALRRSFGRGRAVRKFFGRRRRRPLSEGMAQRRQEGPSPRWGRGSHVHPPRGQILRLGPLPIVASGGGGPSPPVVLLLGLRQRLLSLKHQPLALVVRKDIVAD